MNKNDLNSNIHLSTGNIKSQCTSEITFLTWSLPTKITCPYSTYMCRQRCFAHKNENFENVRMSRKRNLEETYKNTFVTDMINQIMYQLEKSDKNFIVRIHTSGDFYSLDYFKKWGLISEHFKENPKILFQAYTKSMPILQAYEGNIKDINIHLVWSIWEDTLEGFNEMAKQMEMQTFTALPKTQIERAVKNGAFLCKGDCGHCKECYTGQSKSIVIPFH